MRAKLFIIWEERLSQKEQLYALIFETTWVLKKLSLKELQHYSKEHETCLVLPASDCRIHQLHLPKVSPKDLPLAVDAMLEDKVLGNLADFFSYIEKQTGDTYLVFMWDKNTLANIKTFFETHDIKYQHVTLDWFALKFREIFLMPDGGAFVYSDEVQGFLTRSIFKHWFQNYSFDALSMYAAEAYPEYVGVIEVHESFWVWMAKRLSEMPIKDIFVKPKRFNIDAFIKPEILKAYFPKFMLGSIALVLSVFLSIFTHNLFLIKHNQNKLQEMISIADDDIEFRLTRYLEKQKQKNQFWTLWRAVQSAKNKGITIANIQYQQRKMKISFMAANMQIYQQFKHRLNQAHVRILNSQLQTEANGIRLMLELQGAGNE